MLIIIGWDGSEEELQQILEEYGDFDGAILIVTG